jgi:hypothetical protein
MRGSFSGRVMVGGLVSIARERFLIKAIFVCLLPSPIAMMLGEEHHAWSGRGDLNV